MTSLAALQLETTQCACALCGLTQFDSLASHDRHLLGLHTVGCRGCGLIQTNPRPTPTSLDVFYARHYRHFYQGVVHPTDAYVAQHNKDVRLCYTVDFLRGALQLNDTMTLMDYGCGEGSLFIALRKAGFAGRLVGVEPNIEFGRFAAERGAADVFTQIRAVGQVDSVVVNHVLEHIADPVALLKSIGRQMAPGGNLYIDVPDVEEYRSVGDLHIAHLFHFTERTLARLVESAGYVVLRCEKHRPPHHPRSVRLVAALPTVSPASVAVATSRESERMAWAIVRDAEGAAWKWVVMKRLASIPLAKRVYRIVAGKRSGAPVADSYGN